MATIENRDGRYRVIIRKKGFKDIYKTFGSKEDAELYVAWKEDLLENISNFDPGPEALLTLDQAIEMKLKDAENKNLDHRTITSIKSLKQHFLDYLDKSLSELTYENLLEKLKEFMNTKVSRGGGKTKTNLQDASLKTIGNRFRYMSSVIGYINTQGFSFHNHALNVCAYLDNIMKNGEK